MQPSVADAWTSPFSVGWTFRAHSDSIAWSSRAATPGPEVMASRKNRVTSSVPDIFCIGAQGGKRQRGKDKEKKEEGIRGQR